jgi:hypothetical protein
LKRDGYKGNVHACRAYPEEIPYNFPKDDHEEIQDNQVGNYLFKRVTDEMFEIALDDELGEERVKEFL